jgi:hypothetical protein
MVFLLLFYLFTAKWYILWTFGTFVYLVFLFPFWYVVERKIWQPRGWLLNWVQVENFASSKLEVNKFIPVNFATCKFSTWTRFKNRPLLTRQKQRLCNQALSIYPAYFNALHLKKNCFGVKIFTQLRDCDAIQKYGPSGDSCCRPLTAYLPNCKICLRFLLESLHRNFFKSLLSQRIDTVLTFAHYLFSSSAELVCRVFRHLSRVTRCVWEKVAQNVAQSIFCVN